jgi:hypothetical protein
MDLEQAVGVMRTVQTGVAILAPECLGCVYIVRAGIMDLNGKSRGGGVYSIYLKSRLIYAGCRSWYAAPG